MGWKNFGFFTSRQRSFFLLWLEMAGTSTVKFETELSPDGETPQFTLKESDQYRKGHYAFQMTFSRGKVYIHVQGKNLSLS